MKNDNRYNINKEVQLQSNQRNKMKQRVIWLVEIFLLWQMSTEVDSFLLVGVKIENPKTQTCICLH